MDTPLIDLTRGDSSQSCGGSPRPRFKRPRLEPDSRTSSATRPARAGSPLSSTMSSQDPDLTSQEFYISSASDSSDSSLVLPSRRSVGDGFDFRYPRTSNTQSRPTDVVDLTLSDDGEEDNSDANHSSNQNETDDVQITSFQQTAPSLRAQRHDFHRQVHPPRRLPRFPQAIMNEAGETERPRHSQPFPRIHSPPVPRTQHPRTLPPLPPLPPSSARQNGGISRPPNPEVIEIDDEDEPSVLPAARDTRNPRRPEMDPPRPSHVSRAAAVWHTVQQHASLAWRMPGFMDYSRTAFHLGPLDATDAIPRPPQRPASPPLQPLDPPPDGFTRSPQEGDVLICPSCHMELCVGDDENEIRNQVWVVKACGHAYCGACTAKRAKTNRKARDNHLVKCVVEGCGRRVTGQKAMYQLFL